MIWNEAPHRKPASAAADSSLKVGRAPNSFLYLAWEKPVFSRYIGSFQILPGLRGVGRGEDIPAGQSQCSGTRSYCGKQSTEACKRRWWRTWASSEKLLSPTG